MLLTYTKEYASKIKLNIDYIFGRKKRFSEQKICQSYEYLTKERVINHLNKVNLNNYSQGMCYKA